MSLTAIQTATTPNVAYTRLIYTVSGSIYTGQPQFQYVCDVYNRDTNELLKRMTQGINPGGSATFDVARIIQGELEADYNWKINTATEFSSSKQGFEVKLGEQFGTSISSSVTVYPDQATYQIYCNQGVVEPNAGAYNWLQVVDSNTLSNMPTTMSMQSDDYGTISAFVASGTTVISQSFYSASASTYVKVDEKNYSLVSGFDDYFWAIPISSSANYWNYVDVSLSGSYGLNTYRYEASDETHREKTRFAFVNKLGAWDYYNNYNPVRQAIEVEREQYTAARVDYSSRVNTYDISRRGRTDYHNSTDDSFVVDTDLLDKTTANWLEELIESPEVYIQRNGEFIPIIITDSSYTSNTNQARQKQFKYTINFKPSNQPFGTWIPEYVQCPKQIDTSGCGFIVNSNTPATGITTSSMTLSAQLTASLVSDIQEVGFVYSTSSTVPTVDNSFKQEVPGIVYPLTSSIFDLNTGPAFTCGSTVYYRGYASSSIADCDIVYAPVSSDNTLDCPVASFNPYAGGIASSSLMYWYDFTNTGSMTTVGNNIYAIESKGIYTASLTTGSTSKYTSFWTPPTFEGNYTQFYGEPDLKNSTLASNYGASKDFLPGFSTTDTTTTIYFAKLDFTDPGPSDIIGFRNTGTIQPNNSLNFERFAHLGIRNDAGATDIDAYFSSTTSPVSASTVNTLRTSSDIDILGYSYNATGSTWQSTYVKYNHNGTNDLSASRQPSEAVASITSTAFVGSPQAAAEGFAIGSDATSNSTDGAPVKIAHVLIYTGSLSDSQITAVINSFTGSVNYGDEINSISN